MTHASTLPPAIESARPSLHDLEHAMRAGDAGACIALANRLLSAHRFGTAEHERGLELLRGAANGPREREACWLLGAYYLQVTTSPDAHVEAAQWLERAAAFGIAPAIDRLANLHLQGIGVPFTSTRALALLQHLADCGFQQAAWDVGYLLDQADDIDLAGVATAFARCCALGYPPAYYSLGLRFAIGSGVSRDGGFARALLMRAADAGFPDAQDAADELVPEHEHGIEAAAWHRRLKENLGAAQSILRGLEPGNVPVGRHALNPSVVALEEHFAGIAHPSLRMAADKRLRAAFGSGTSLRTTPKAFDWLCERPKIATIKSFAAREECAHLIHKSGASLKRPSAYLRQDSDNDASEGEQFNGQGHVIRALEADAVVRTVERRIAAMADWSMAALEPGSIIRYQPGEEYLPHVDSFSREQIQRNRDARGDFGGQRTATFLLYLRIPQDGGETMFHHPGLLVRGERGMGLLHYNAIPDGSQDAESLHSGRPVVSGEKWLWRSTLREHSLYPTGAGLRGLAPESSDAQPKSTRQE